jgi:Secretion system C-terminal sorting domain
MKRLLVIFGLFACVSTHAQINLVLDGSFEDTTYNWQSFIGEGSLSNWHSLNNSPFVKVWYYMSTKKVNDTINFKLPNNWFCDQYPKYGCGTIRIGTFTRYPHSSNRALVKGKLLSTLVIGKSYCASASVAALERGCDVITNGFSMYFDTGELDTMITIHHDSTSIYTFVQPQVQCPFLISDTINWTKVQGSFVANGTETHVNLSNFLSDSATLKDFEIDGSIYGVQDILVDNVSLIPMDITQWLPDYYAAPTADSAWIGLDVLDYADGSWYTANMQYITTAPGFWLQKSGMQSGTQFIHGIDICGVTRYDTTTFYFAPLSIGASAVQSNFDWVLYPNPAKTGFYVKCTNEQLQEAKVQVYDAVGKRVAAQLLQLHNGTGYFDARLAPGVYMVLVVDEKMKLVIE